MAERIAATGRQDNGVFFRWLATSETVLDLDIAELKTRVTVNGSWKTVGFSYFSSKTSSIESRKYSVKWVKNSETEKMLIRHRTFFSLAHSVFTSDYMPDSLEGYANIRTNVHPVFTKMNNEFIRVDMVQHPASINRNLITKPQPQIVIEKIINISQVGSKLRLTSAATPLFLLDLDNTMVNHKQVDGQEVFYSIKGQENMAAVLLDLSDKFKKAKFVVISNSTACRAHQIIMDTLKLDTEDFLMIDCSDDSCYSKKFKLSGEIRICNKFRRLECIFEDEMVAGKFDHLVFIDDQRAHINEVASFAQRQRMNAHLYHMIGATNVSNVIRAENPK